MKMFLARQEKKLHSLIWVIPKDEYDVLDEPRKSLISDPGKLAVVNEFLSAKDPHSLLQAIFRFEQPLFHRELVLSDSFGADAEGIKRCYSVDEFVAKLAKNDFTTGSRRALANECWLLLPGNEGVANKESSAKRAIGEFDLNGLNGIEDAINQNGRDCVVVVEPLLDWLWMKNMLSLMLSLKHSLSADSHSSGASILEALGFSEVDISSTGGSFSQLEKARLYAIPIIRSDYSRFSSFADVLRETITGYYLPSGRKGFFRWSPYSKMGFRRGGTTMRPVVELVDCRGERSSLSILYLSQVVAEGKSGITTRFLDSDQNLYLAIVDKCGSTTSIARAFYEEFLFNRLCNESIGSSFHMNDSGFIASTLESRLWLSLLGFEGINLGRCKVCGLPFFTKGNTGKTYCSNACLQSDR